MATTCEINGQKADIKYPCDWEYKIILLKDVDVREIVEEIILEKEYRLSPSNKSKSGKYSSYNLTILVNNDSEREWIFGALKQNKNIKYVL